MLLTLIILFIFCPHKN